MADPEPDRPEPPSAATPRLREFLARDVPHAEIAVRLGLPLVEAKRRIAALGGLAGEGRSAEEPDGGTERRQRERVASPPQPRGTSLAGAGRAGASTYLAARAPGR